jgi:hypothetical protein
MAATSAGMTPVDVCNWKCSSRSKSARQPERADKYMGTDFAWPDCWLTLTFDVAAFRAGQLRNLL